jgi:hypothetical protein
MNDDELERIAHHEAGHAVLCWVAGYPPEHASIIPDHQEGFLGKVLIGELAKKIQNDTGIFFSETRVDVERCIVSFMAGGLSEAVFSGQDEPNDGSAHDDRTIMMLLDSLHSNDQELIQAHHHLLRVYTRKQIEFLPNKTAIEAVAAALLKDQELGSEQLEDTILAGLKDGYEKFAAAVQESARWEEERRAAKSRRLAGRRRYTPGRGGHAPGHLREALLDCLPDPLSDEQVSPWWETLADPETPWYFDGSRCAPWAHLTTRERARWLTGQLWNCNDILPGSCRDEFKLNATTLDLSTGRATYAVLARALRADLDASAET